MLVRPSQRQTITPSSSLLPPLRYCALTAAALLLAGCGGPERGAPRGNVFHTTISRVRTLDPALASDVSSGVAVGHLYDRLLQYHYSDRPYRLVPAMAAGMPEVSEDGLTVVFGLRDDLFFHPDACFGGDGSGEEREARRVRARDVVFSLLRIADLRVHSSGYWIFRGYIRGMDEFRKRSTEAGPGDMSPYERGIPGLEARDERTVVFRLTKPYPRLLHVLAMPYCSVVSARAASHYGGNVYKQPVGSGPFQLEQWRRNYRFVLRKSAEFRAETYPGTPLPLPRLDRVVCHVVQEPLTAWLLFLQGNLDLTGLSSDNVEAVVERGVDLTPELRERGVRLWRFPQFQINYVAFNAADPQLGRNALLRQAISLAYNVEARVEVSNNQLIPASGPIPPGVSGHDPELSNPFARYDLVQAKQLLAEAGFPGGIDPGTGRALSFTFDLGGTDVTRRQQADMMVADMKKLGVEIVPRLNNWPRFLQRIRRGDVQIFRITWVGDYPDGQNFLQLFYGPNAGSCNRARYRSAEFDAVYERAEPLGESAERERLYQKMQELLVGDCPWIFESYPVAFRLSQPWVERYIPHHFAYDQWKYIGIDQAMRESRRPGFRPLRLRSGT